MWAKLLSPKVLPFELSTEKSLTALKISAFCRSISVRLDPTFSSLLYTNTMQVRWLPVPSSAENLRNDWKAFWRTLPRPRAKSFYSSTNCIPWWAQERLKGTVLLYMILIVSIANYVGRSMDASNLLKPQLARGELHCVGATTLSEYRKVLPNLVIIHLLRSSKGESLTVHWERPCFGTAFPTSLSFGALRRDHHHYVARM